MFVVDCAALRSLHAQEKNRKEVRYLGPWNVIHSELRGIGLGPGTVATRHTGPLEVNIGPLRAILKWPLEPRRQGRTTQLDRTRTRHRLLGGLQ